jgi:hypothetical protein
MPRPLELRAGESVGTPRRCRRLISRRRSGATTSPELSEPVQRQFQSVHGLALPNRIWMSAITRTRATSDGVPTHIMGGYYAQRATAGLIVTECTAVSEQGKGVINGPGLWKDAQVMGWREVTEAVHNVGGRTFCQLWHLRTRRPPVYARRRAAGCAFAVAGPTANSSFWIWKRISQSRGNSPHGKSPGSCQTSPRPRDVRAKRASMGWSCMLRTVICTISFCRASAISASTPGVVP